MLDRERDLRREEREAEAEAKRIEEEKRRKTKRIIKLQIEEIKFQGERDIHNQQYKLKLTEIQHEARRQAKEKQRLDKEELRVEERSRR